MTDIPDLIARVRELDKAATKGPWVAPHAHVQQRQAGYVYRAEGMASQVARTMSTTRGMCDAALIAYYRTAAPALADECERLRERVSVLEEALRPFAFAAGVFGDSQQVGVVMRDAPVTFHTTWRARAVNAPVLRGADFNAARLALEGKP